MMSRKPSHMRSLLKRWRNGCLVITRLIGLRQTCCGCVLNIQSSQKLSAIRFRGRLWTKIRERFGFYSQRSLIVFSYIVFEINNARLETAHSSCSLKYSEYCSFSRISRRPFFCPSVNSHTILHSSFFNSA